MGFIGGLILGQYLYDNDGDTKPKRPPNIPLFLEVSNYDGRHLIDVRTIQRISETTRWIRNNDNNKVEVPCTTITFTNDSSENVFETYDTIKERLGG